MNPPDTKSKEQSDMSTAGGPPPERAQATPGPAAALKEDRSRGQRKDLNAYYGAQHAIKGVTIDFPANEVTALIGPSGSGKSTWSAASTGCTRRSPARAPRAA